MEVISCVTTHGGEHRTRPQPPVSYSSTFFAIKNIMIMIMISNNEQGQSHLYHTHLSIIIIEHRNRQEPSVSYLPLHDHQEHHVNDDHQPSNKARAISIILSPKVFFMIITIIIEHRTRPYQPTCSDKDIRFHSDPQSSMA